MAKSMFTNNDSSTELAWEVLKKQQACFHTDYCITSCDKCEVYVTSQDLAKAIDIIIENYNFECCPKCGQTLLWKEFMGDR